MGKFANADDGSGMRLSAMAASGKSWNGESGFDAMGCVVPAFRKAAAERHMKDMGFTDAAQRYDVVAVMADRIARDNSHEALEQALKKGVDATGCYRLLSVLLCEPAPPAEPAPEPTYVDLVTL